MARVELDVPFFEKLEAKRLGARWDAGRRVWYLPDGANQAAFSRWCYPERDTGIRSRRYLVAVTSTCCWRCNQDTRVWALVLPAMHKTRSPGAGGQAQWLRHKLPCILRYVTDLPPSVMARMHAHTPSYRIGASATSGAYFMNHCEACGLKFEDAGLHLDPGAPFAPLDVGAAARITLHEVPEPFSCNGAASYGDFFFSVMRRA